MTRYRALHPTETMICIGIMEYVSKMTPLYPEMAWIFHTPNEAKRHYVTARRLKAMGMKAGILDYKWDIARGGYHGFAMEVKDRKGKTTDAQDNYMDFLVSQGYYVCLVRSVDAGIREIIDYYAGRTVRNKPDLIAHQDEPTRDKAGPLGLARVDNSAGQLTIPGTRIIGKKAFVKTSRSG